MANEYFCTSSKMKEMNMLYRMRQQTILLYAMSEKLELHRYQWYDKFNSYTCIGLLKARVLINLFKLRICRDGRRNMQKSYIN